MCPNCGLTQETSKHLTRCSHVCWVNPFQELIKDVQYCFEQVNVDVDLITIIEDYLLCQGSATMTSLTPLRSKYMPLAIIQDRLGWDCFLEGRIPYALLETVHPFMTCWNPRKTIIHWGVSLIKALLSVTHQQWLF
jgi:hypothetical protein